MKRGQGLRPPSRRIAANSSKKRRGGEKDVFKRALVMLAPPQKREITVKEWLGVAVPCQARLGGRREEGRGPVVLGDRKGKRKTRKNNCSPTESFYYACMGKKFGGNKMPLTWTGNWPASA